MASPPIEKIASEVFEDACELFRRSLSENQRRAFKSYPMASNMLDSIKRLVEDHPVHKSRLTKVFERIKSFASRPRPFLEIVNTFVQTNPQYSGLVWGAIQLVFMIGTNYITFLDKISIMIEKMTISLPAYEDYLESLHSRAIRARQEQKDHNVSSRLLKALAYVYADILQFCQEACELFSNSGRGALKKASFINALVWNPFDKRFNDLILRFNDHKKLFELEMNVASNQEALRFYTMYEENMRNGENHKRKQTVEENQQEEKDMKDRVDKLKEWISPPLWLNSLEKAQDQRSPSTGLWLFGEPVFKSWLFNVTTPQMSIGRKTMHNKAKPGYGKTTLCGLVIEHLLCSQNQLGLPAATDTDKVGNVAFYFFEKQRKKNNLPGDALRAILAQLIHMHKNNKAVIDVASVIWAKDETGQSSISTNEVSAILQILLRQIVSTTLVFDGVDECPDTESFFKCIREVTREADHVSLLFFSRPTIKLSPYFPKDHYSLDLAESQNLSDMTSFATPKIEELLESGALAKVAALTAKQIAHKIARRANGMFLWTSLFIDYLQSPALTMRERWDGLENLNRLEGLDALCSRILASLKDRYYGKARTNIKRAFQWVAHAFRPLRIVELNYALNIPPDRAIDHEDLIPNFKESLQLMSGALLEPSPDKTVRFIHLSILEFLTGAGSDCLDDFDAHGFNFHKSSTHRHIAASCLSYFCYTVPAEPLSGNASITPDASYQNSKFPFLDYASQFWTRHVFASLVDTPPSNSGMDDDYSWDQLAALVSTFLYNKSMVSAWIEASWLFGAPPELNVTGQQPEIPSFLRTIVPQEQVQDLRRLLADMGRLSSDLETLNASWSHVLKTEPNEIWQPSISAFQQSDFWMRIAGSRLQPIGQDEKKYEVLCSQVSLDGLLLGIVKHEGYDLLSYEIWTIASNMVKYAWDLAAVPWEPTRSDMSISRDLRKLCVGDYLVKINTDQCFPQAHGPTTLQDHRLSFSLQQIRPSCERESWPSDGFRGQFLNRFPQTVRQLVENNKFGQRIHKLFSPKGDYILVGLESMELVDLDTVIQPGRKQSHRANVAARLWMMEVFRDTDHHTSPEARKPNFLESQNLTHYFPPSGTKIEYLDREIAFHPFLPRLALSRWDDTCLWDFNSNIEITPVAIHEPPLARIAFTDDGIYLYGLKPNTHRYPESQGDPSEYQSIDILVKLSMSRPLLIDQSAPNTSTVDPTHANLDRAGAARHSEASLSLRSTPASHLTGNVGIGRDHNGVGYMSILRGASSEGALVRQTVREDGTAVSETLTRLPESIKANSNATILASTTTGSTEVIRILLNKSHQDFTLGNDSNAADTLPLPAILERTRSTIPTFIPQLPMTIGFDFDNQSNSRKRLMISDGRFNKRPRHS